MASSKNKNTNFNILGIVYVVLSLIAIVTLLILFLNCHKKKSENFCACRHMTDKKCPSPQVLTDLYDRNILTENTVAQALNQGGKWKTYIMPDDRWAMELRERDNKKEM
jgi:hypothetical protein